MTARAERPVSFILVSHSYIPVVGGSEVEAQRVGSELMARGHRVLIACAAWDVMPRATEWQDPKGLAIRIYGRNNWGSHRVRDILFALRVAWLLFRDRRNYDIVYFLMQGLHVATGLPVARLLRKPAVLKVGGSNVIPLLERSFMGRLELWMMRRWLHRLMILNDGMRTEAVEHGFSPDQLLWMPNPVDTSEFAPLPESERSRRRAETGIPANAPLAVYTGRLAPEKGVHLLLEAFAEVVGRVSGAMLALVGDGPERRALEQRAQALGILPVVKFVGRVSPSEVASWLQIADLFALVSPSEGFSCALCEAMAVGLPSVVTDIPANRQLIAPEEQGLLVPYGDTSAIAGAISSLLLDTNRAKRMGASARQFVAARFGTAAVCDRYERLFSDALGGQMPRRARAG